MSWKLGLAMTGILGLALGGIFFVFAGQIFLPQEGITQSEPDEAPAPFAAESQEPPAVLQPAVRPMEDNKIILVAAKEDDSSKGALKTPQDPRLHALDAKTGSDKNIDPPQPVTPPGKPDVAPTPEPIAPPPAVVPLAPPTSTIVPVAPPVTPMLPTGPPPLDVKPPAATGPISVGVPVRDVAVICPWSIHLEVVKGRTVVTAKAGKEASFRIECDQLDLQAPKGCVRASGKVKISGPNLEGVSNVMILNLQEDRLMLEGEVKVNSMRDNQELELTGERLSLRLINNGTELKKVTANVPASLTVAPSIVQMGAIKIGDKVEKRVFVRGRRPFRILGVEGMEGGLSVEVNNEARTSHILIIRCEPTQAGDMRKDLLIRTDLDREMVPVTVEFKIATP